MSVERHPGFETQSVACSQPTGDGAILLASIQYRVPNPRARRLIRWNVDLKAVFPGVARAPDEHILDPADSPVCEPVILYNA